MSTTKIAELRKARGMTQKDLALLLRPKTSDVQISRLESEDRRLTLDWMRRIARAFGVKVIDLLPEDDYHSGSQITHTLHGNLSIEFDQGQRMNLSQDDIIRLAKLGWRYLEHHWDHEALKRERDALAHDLRPREPTA